MSDGDDERDLDDEESDRRARELEELIVLAAAELVVVEAELGLALRRRTPRCSSR